MLSKLKPGYYVAFWTILNLLQAHLTETHNDESYYWFYTQKLEWGYYDHPPMVALFASLGQSFSNGELALRLGNVLAMSGALWLCLLMVPADTRRNTYLILLGVPFLHYLSFMVFPDGPLLFFFMLFLYGYRGFVTLPRNWHILIMGLSLAFMLYSKYHAVLVLPLVVLSNPRSLFKPWLYQVALLAFVLYIPHLLWQFQNDFPSFQFHLTGRAQSFRWSDVGNFIGQQMAAVGLVLILAIVHKPKDSFERLLKVIVIGVLVFFLVMSFRGFVHIQWTSLAYFPAAILSSIYIQRQSRSRLLLLAFVPWVLLTLLLRVQLAFPLLPSKKIGPNYVHGQSDWANQVASIVPEDGVLVYENDLKEPSMYSFYSGRQSMAFYPGYRKKSQYWMWGLEDSIQTRPALIAKRNPFEGAKELNQGKRKLFYKTVDSFQSFQNIKVEIIKVEQLSGGYTSFAIEVYNHRKSSLVIDSRSQSFLLKNMVSGELKNLIPDTERIVILPESVLSISVRSTEKITRGEYVIAIDDGLLSPSHNSKIFTVE